MAHFRAARRYAKALFDLAVEREALDAVQEDLAALRRLLEATPDLTAFLDNHLLPPGRRVETLQALFEGRAHPLVMRFLLFLEARKRMAVLPDIFGAFAEMCDERRGLVRATVTSAHPLTDRQRDTIAERLRTRLGREVAVRTALDPALLGGFRVQVGDLVHDYSVETQLQRLRARLMSA